MKKVLILIGAVAALVLGAVAFEPVDPPGAVTVYVPETNQFVLQFDHRRDEPTVFYEVWLASGGQPFVKWQTIGTNDFTVVAVTNQDYRLRAAINGLPRGTNALALVAVSPLLNAASEGSTNLWLGVLSFPAAPRGLLKP